MSEGLLANRPIWDDVRTLRGTMLPRVDIIVGGFPCQDISVAGRGAGLEGERSGLFFEICRLAEEIKPAFLFLENVPAIRTRGAARVIEELSRLGYDCRWTTLSAAAVGAPHLRERWFLLAYRSSVGRSEGRTGSEVRSGGQSAPEESMAHARGDAEFHAGDETEAVEPERLPRLESRSSGARQPESYTFQDVADRNGQGLEVRQQGNAGELPSSFRRGGWKPEPDVGRVAHGIPFRVDRIKCLGNAVVPAQAREAFLRLLGVCSE
jgi:DNA (cytosine-5)-methyltransferase 1